MKNKKSILIAFALMLIASIVYRIFPNRPVGFAPQFAIGLLAGAMVGRKAWAFALPLLSMFLSDVLYQLIYLAGYGEITGFYTGQWQNYLLFTVLTSIGFLIKKINVVNVLLASIISPTIFFVLSNFILWAGWAGTRGLGRPKTWDGLIQCYSDAIPFYQNNIISTIAFSTVFFGIMYWIVRPKPQHATITTKL